MTAQRAANRLFVTESHAHTDRSRRRGAGAELEGRRQLAVLECHSLCA